MNKTKPNQNQTIIKQSKNPKPNQTTTKTKPKSRGEIAIHLFSIETVPHGLLCE